MTIRGGKLISLRNDIKSKSMALKLSTYLLLMMKKAK